MKRKIIFYALSLIFAAVFIISMVQILQIQGEYDKGVKEYSYLFNQAITLPDEISTANKPENPAGFLGFIINYDEMYALNHDYVGWIYIPNTMINYPMVSSNDNEYYLHHTFLKEYNFAGTLFLDSLTSSLNKDNVIIYGHRMNNNSMFHDLEYFLDESFYTDNKNIYIFTENELRVYEVLSARIVELDDACYTITFNSNNPFDEWTLKMKSRSRYPISLVPVPAKNVITLSTCVKGSETLRIIVQAQLTDSYPLS